MMATTLSSPTSNTSYNLSPLSKKLEVKYSELLLEKVITKKLFKVKLRLMLRLPLRIVPSLLLGVDPITLLRSKL